ncbi:MAG: acyl carrier protein [Holophagales bacterium]|jgi:acyl carrier protein|nr:acyl carrier protein [Holophagales bacterium]
MADTKSKVIALIAETLAQPEESITENKHFIDDLGADSLDLVEIMMAIEENLGIAIPENEQEKIKTVGDVIAFVENHSQA